jgi:hypothetical protein
MRISNWVGVGIVMTALTGSAIAMADPACGPVTIVKASYVGSGCPVGDPIVYIVGGSDLYFAFSDKFTAAVGGNTGHNIDRKSCTISLLLDTPAGFKYRLTTFQSNGDVQLAAGATAQHATTYWFQGTSPTAYSAQSFSSADDGDWSVDDSFSPSDVYSLCGHKRYLNITTSVAASVGSSDPAVASEISVDRAHASTYHLDFVPCP